MLLEKKDLGRACLVSAVLEMAEICGIPATGNEAQREDRVHNAAHYISEAAEVSVDKVKQAWKEAKNPMSKGKRFIAVQRPDDRG